MPDAAILEVGDRPITNLGRLTVERIAVCLRPSTDPAGETHYVEVEAVEVGEHGPPFVVSLEGGTWAYGIHVQGENIEKGDGNEG